LALEEKNPPLKIIYSKYPLNNTRQLNLTADVEQAQISTWQVTAETTTTFHNTNLFEAKNNNTDNPQPWL
jgi:hypothetical protein